MAAPVGFIPDNAPEGFLPEEPEAPKPVSAAEALGFATTAPQQITSALTRTLEAGAEPSAMGREQISQAREQERQKLGELGIGAQPVSAADILRGVESIPRYLGKFAAATGRTIRDVLSPTTYLPEEEQAKLRPFVISPGEIRQMTAAEQLARDPLQQGKPLISPRLTQLEPEGSDAAKQIAALSTPESIAMLAAGGGSRVAGYGLLATMAPSVLDDVKEVVRSDASPQEKRDRINSLIVPVILGLESSARRPGVPTPERAAPTEPQLPVRLAELPPEQPMTGAKVPVTLERAEAAPVPAVEPVIPAPVPEAPVEPVSPAKTESILNKFADKSAEEWFSYGQGIQKQSMEGQGPSLQIIAEQTALALPEESVWQAELDKVREDQKQLIEELQKDPSQMANRQTEIMGLAAKGQFFDEGLKIIRKQKAPEPIAATPTTATETTPPMKGERLTAAAYKTQEGTIETGAHHPAILRRLGIPGFETRESRNTPQFGYVTTHRPFVPRGQISADIAKISGQKLEPFDVDPMTGQEMPHSNEIESITETGKAISETKPPVPETITPKSETIKPELPVEVDSPTAEIGSGGETGVEMARHGTTSGLPPSVPDRGPGFSGELLEASRQLGTLVRSRVTLPKNVLGQYVRARSAIGQMDRIEVGDIRNQLTVSHEMGHDLDALIWDKINLSRSQRSLEERVPGTSGKDLQKELIPISELMRGQITGTRGHQAYRKSATELIADFFALYAHDPEKARAMSPKFSEGFENALAKKPDAAGVINQLLEGNVEPVPAEQAYKGPAVSPVQTPGKILSRLMPDPVKRDFPAAVAAQDLVKGTVREFESRVQRARVVADKWREQVPNKAERNDVGAFVEGIGNIEIPGDTIDAVVSRMTPAMRDFAKKYRFAIEAQRNDINAYLKGAEEGEYLKFLEDYLAHFYANTGTATGRSGLSKFMKDSPNAKARKLPTNREAVEMGLIPITQDPSVLYEHHANINWRTATNRQLMQSLKDMRLSTGEPAVLPAKDAPPGWTITQNPLVQKVYARQTPGGVMIWKGGAAIHPDVWHAVRQILENPVSSDLAKGFDALNGLTRANAFAFSLFHDITLRSAAVGEMAGVNPLRGLFRLFERNPTTGEIEAFRSTRGLGKELLKDEEAVADAAKNGLKFSWTESESYQRNARDFLEKMAAKWREVPYLGKTAALARDIQHMRQEGLWKNTHDAFKIIAYNDAVSKALADAPKGINVDAVKQQISSRLNDAFGGQEWQTKFWLSPQIRRAMSRFFLAPDWTLSTLRSVPLVSDAASVVRTQAPRLAGREPGLANFEGVGGNLGRARFWAGELAALASATIATQYAVYSAMGDPKKGDQPWVWDNETGQKRRIDITPIIRNLPWHDEKDRTRYYVNLGKRPEEILSWFIHPEVNIQSKMSRPVAEIYHQISGMEGDFKEPWKQDHETFVESIPKRAVSISKEFVPFVFAGNQFALSVPYRKGMTKSKAQNAYESAYELAAEPSRLRSLMRGQQPSEGSLTQMVSEVTDAAIRNGVPAEQIRKRALSTVRGHHYNLYFKALQANDKPAMEKEAIALQRLGATGQGLERSIQIRSQ